MAVEERGDGWYTSDGLHFYSPVAAAAHEELLEGAEVEQAEQPAPTERPVAVSPVGYEAVIDEQWWTEADVARLRDEGRLRETIEAAGLAWHGRTRDARWADLLNLEAQR